MNRIFFILFVFSITSCTYDKVEEPAPGNGFPTEVSAILVNKCATQGCHNTASRNSVAGLDFSTWEKMFEGGRNGGSVIPYAEGNSFMLYSINTDTSRSPVLLPTMPYQEQPLSESEYQTLVNWISNGSPDQNGLIKFSDNPDRKKIYICMQGCDKVAILDAKTKVIMRYVNIGVDPIAIEGPHQIRVSPDGKFWYAVFFSSNKLQKFRTSDDALVATLELEQTIGNWNTIIITHDGKKGFVNDPTHNKTIVVNLETMVVETIKSFDSPHGGFVSSDGHYLYLTTQFGKTLTKVDLTTAPFYDDATIGLGSTAPLNPHEAMLSPDGTKYFVSCQGTNEVRVMNASNDSLIAVIPVGQKPQEFDVSTTHPYIFVTCTEASISSNQKGLLYVIDYNTNTIVATLYTGYQPHGIAVDDEEDLVYVANLNYDDNGPAPHHVSECGGRNGYLTIVDVKTLQLYSKTQSDGFSYQYKNELLAYPYFVSIRK